MNSTLFETCKDFCNQQAVVNWSNASLGIVEIIFTSLNIAINYIVYKKLDIRKDVFNRERLFQNNH